MVEPAERGGPELERPALYVTSEEEDMEHSSKSIPASIEESHPMTSSAGLHGDHGGPAELGIEPERTAEAPMQPPCASPVGSPKSEETPPAGEQQHAERVSEVGEIPDPTKELDQPSSSGGAAATGDQTPSTILLGLLPGSGHPLASPGGSAAATAPSAAPTATATRTSSSDCPKICRFCHEEDSDEPGDRLIAPCLCMGTVK